MKTFGVIVRTAVQKWTERVIDMRDRLIELIQDTFNKQFYERKRFNAGFAADYLLANGVIVPPCNVGDTVYEFFDVRGFYDISELIVENIVVGINPSKCVLYCKSKQSNSKSMFYNDSFGKTLFFNRGEAEQALKERLNNG